MEHTHTTHVSTVELGAGLLFGPGAAALGILSPSRPLVGVGIYVVAAVLALGLSVRSDGGDTGGSAERFSSADVTLGLLGPAAAVVFPALVAANGLGYFTWTGFSTGVAVTVAVVFVAYGVVGLVRLVRS